MAIMKPESAKAGAYNITAPSDATVARTSSRSLQIESGINESTARMSPVLRVRTREMGVESNHLKHSLSRGKWYIGMLVHVPQRRPND